MQSFSQARHKGKVRPNTRLASLRPLQSQLSPYADSASDTESRPGLFGDQAGGTRDALLTTTVRARSEQPRPCAVRDPEVE